MKKRILAMIMTLAMCLSLLPTAAFAASTAPAVDGKYESDGWVQEGNGTLTYPDGNGGNIVLSKTATPVKGDPNTYNITLQVKTAETTSITDPSTAATVLVIDVSGSMDFCADCGEKDSHDSECTYYNMRDNRVKDSQSRMKAAKDAALEFLKNYAGNTPNAGRYLSIVKFSSSGNLELEWVDVSGGDGQQGYEFAKWYLNHLTANGGTNLDDGLSKANTQMGKKAISSVPVANRNVIALTDGAPTYARGLGDGMKGSKQINDKTAATATNLKKNASVYTVCFGVANEYCYDGGPTVGSFLADSIATPTKTNEDGTKTTYAYNADNTAALNTAFKAITDSVTNGLKGDGSVVTDPMSRYVNLDGSSITSENGGASATDNTISWTLGSPETVTEGNTTSYVYTLTYQVTLKEEYRDRDIHPANANTYLTLEDGRQFAFPVPGLKGEPTIVITAVSDSKMYDGTPLTNDEYTYNKDLLLEGDVLTAVVEGTITDAGTAANVVTSYKVMRGETDVTDQYLFGESVDGTLEVTKRTVTLTSATDSKLYDGTPLTNDEVTVGGNGFAEGEGATYNVTGSQTDPGTTDNEFTYTLNNNTKADNYEIIQNEGKLTVTKIAKEIVITANSNSKMYDGSALIDSGYTYTQGILQEGDKLTAVVEGTITDVGTTANVVTSYKVMRGETDVTAKYTFGDSVNGTLEVTKRKITLTSATDSKTYDGTALINGEVIVTGDGFATGEGATYTATGSQTDAGSSANTITYTLNEGTKADNYDITITEGTLTVTKRTVTLTSGTDSKKYDGSALTNGEITVGGNGFAEGEGATYDVTGSQTDAGSSANTFTYTLNEGTKADNYDITITEGTLTVTKRTVTLTSATDSKVYDGTPLTNDKVTVGGDGFVTGEGATYNVTGSLTDPGTTDNEFTYTLNNNTKADNYEITQNEGKLTVTKIAKEIVITAASGEKVYDGTPLTNNGYTYTENVLAEGDVLTAVVEGTITNVGTAENVVTSYQVMRGETDVTANYNFGESVDGVLKVTPVKITITAGSDTKTYDGTPLTKNSYELTAGALVANNNIESVTVTGSLTVVGTSDNVPSEAVIKNAAGDVVTDNYAITYENGTLTVTKKAITITAASGEKVYDGTPLTNDNYTSTDLAAGDRIASVKVTGTQTKVGTSNNIPYALQIVNADGEDVTLCYQETYVNGTLKVTPKALTITADSDTKVYDGTELTKDSATGAGLAEGDAIASVTVTGSQTVVGTSNNVPTAAVIENAAGEDVTASYTISYANGTLEVTKKPITITADGDTKVYDGTALTKNSYTKTDLAEGDVIESVTVTGSQIVAGSSDNVPDAAVIKNAAGDDVTSNYEITYVDGTLTVTPKALTITADSGEKVYDGTPLTKDTYTSEGLATGDSIASVTVTGSQTVVGTSDNVPSAAKIVNASGADVSASYTISYANGTLEVTKKPITITADSASKTYDGEPLTKNSYTSTDLAEGDKIDSVTVTGSQTEVGKSDNVPNAAVIKNADGDDVSSSYEITYANGTLEVTKKPSRPSTPNIPDNPPALNKVDHFAYIVGYPDGNVEPQGNITRAEVATIFFRMLTDESRAEFWSQSNDYSDVTATKWFNNAVSTLSNGGIITGYNNGTFKPNGNITRAEFATMAVRFFSASYEGEDLFPDIDKHWAKAYINTAAYEGIINGYEDGTFRPDQYITRAEAMTIVNRVLDRHPDKDNLLEDMIQWPDNMDTEKWYYADVQEATNSHDYDMEGTEAEPYEVWTEILPVRDWVALEKEWSDSNSAPGGEVMN